MNARKHWESESRNRNLSAAVVHVKPSRHKSNLYDSREYHHQKEILNCSDSLQYSKRNRDFITINFQKFSFFQGVFHVLERYIGFEPSDLFPLTIKRYSKCLQNYNYYFFVLFFFTSESGNLLKYIKNIHFSSSFERPMEISRRNTASWQRTCLWQMTCVMIVSCRSADFNMFQMTYKYNSLSSKDFGLLKKVDQFSLKDDNQRRDFSSGYCP